MSADQERQNSTTPKVPEACAVIVLGTCAIVAGLSIGLGSPVAAILTAIGIPGLFVGLMGLLE